MSRPQSGHGLCRRPGRDIHPHPHARATSLTLLAEVYERAGRTADVASVQQRASEAYKALTNAEPDDLDRYRAALKRCHA